MDFENLIRKFTMSFDVNIIFPLTAPTLNFHVFFRTPPMPVMLNLGD